ncbi:MAG: radical SAM protein [Chloroflexi bacterium]|nr:radical SAM protein [Chloroflexota bacterium]
MVQVREIEARTAVNRVEGMPFRWSLNPYRGCAHGCRFCFARGTHQFLDLGPGADFERVIFAKVNLAAVLRRELGRSGPTAEPIAVGTVTDPYQPIEGRYRITRRCLEVLAELGNPCSLTTRGTLIVRDVDVLQTLVARTRCTVHVSLITLDEALCRRLEPGAPPPHQRLRAIRHLRDAGVPVTLFLMPVLPDLTDRPDQLAGVVRAALDHGVTAVHADPLRLAPRVKDWFLARLGESFPELPPAYRRLYRFSDKVPQAYRDRLREQVATMVADGLPAPREAASGRAAPIWGQLRLPLDERSPAAGI